MDHRLLLRVKGVLVVVGSVLIFLTLGSVYSFGNFTTYLTSYIRARASPHTLRYGESVWIFSLAIGSQGAFMFLGGLINLKIGVRWTALLGGLTMSLGTFLSYFTIQWSFIGCLLTYGVLFGAGVGIAYAPPLKLAMAWHPKRKGLVNGIALAGFGGGALIFDQIQTAFTNPGNKSPDLPQAPGSSERYFSEEAAGDVLDRVPHCFLVLGACFTLMQVLGCLMLFTHPADKVDSVRVLESEEDVSDSDAPYRKRVDSTESLVDQPAVALVADMRPGQVLRGKAFWMLWFMFLFTGQAVTFSSTLYKIYGQTFINDDRFLAVVGSLASVCNAGGRVLWGYIVDRFSFRTSMLVLCACLCALLLTITATELAGKALFLVWVCGLFLCFSGTFALYPTVTATSFGPKYMPINFGLLFTSQAVTGILGALLTSQLPNMTTWFGIFAVSAGFTFAAMILAFFFNVRNSAGSDV